MSDEPLLGLIETVRALDGTPHRLSLPTLKSYIDEAGEKGSDDHPFVRTWGSNGKSYGISLTGLVSWLDARAQAEAEDQRKKDAATAQLQMSLLGGEGLSTPHTLTAKQKSEIFDAAIKESRVRRDRGELVEVTKVEEIDRFRMSFIVTFLQGLPDYLARRTSIDALQQAELIEAVDQFQDRLIRFLMEEDFLGSDYTQSVIRAMREVVLYRDDD